MAAPTTDVDICNLALDLLKQNKTIVSSITSPTTEEEKTCARWYDTTREALLRSHFWLFARKRKRILVQKKTITGATQADPVVITATAHGHSDGDDVQINDVVGMTELNTNVYVVANQVANTFELTDIEGNNIDGTAFTAYTSGGKVTPYSFGYPDKYTVPTDYLRLHFIGTDSTNNYDREYDFEARSILINNSGAVSLNIGYIKDATTVTEFDPLFLNLLAAELANNMAYKWTLKNTVIKRLETLLEDRRAQAKAVNGQDRPPKRVQRSKFVDARKKLTTLGADKYTYFD